MIRPLRRRHLRLTAVAVVIGPAVFVLGLTARREMPVMDAVPPGMAVPAVAGPVDTLRIGDTWVAVAAGESRTGGLGLRLVPVPDSLPGRSQDATVAYGPDVLLYWSDRPVDEALPAEAWLLGPLRGERPAYVDVPPALRGSAGYLVVYSLGWQRLLGSVPFTLPADAN